MWGWLVAVYLFCGGLASGSFVSIALLQLAHGTRHMRTVRAGSLLCLAALVAGVLALLADVGAPLRALNMAASFSRVSSSWMARGAWALLGCGLLFGAYALLSWLPARGALSGWLPRWRQPALNLLGTLGIVLAGFLGLYSGALLAASAGIDAWRTPLLPALFLLSALETGFSCIAALLGTREGLVAPPHGIDAAALSLAVGEACVAVLFALHVAATGTFEALAEKGAPFGWPAAFGAVFAVALLFAACLPGMHLLRRPSGPRGWTTAALSCVAGFALRLWVLSLGVHTDPLAIW